MEIEAVAKIHTDFPKKFGIPRQSGLADKVTGKIVFESEFKNPDCIRGLEGFSHIWLIWGFSMTSAEGGVSLTVRPPRLGGNKRVGVFATRSPNRPNPLGLSCVRLDKIEYNSAEGPMLYVSGVDLADGTPIFDIKPYIPFSDCKTDASGGFAADNAAYRLEVNIPEELKVKIKPEKLPALIQVLSQDPRPAYHKDADRVYGMTYAEYEIKFRAEDSCVYVVDVICSANQ